MIVRLAVIDACRKLSPRKQLENPVMFLVYVSAVLTTCFYLEELERSRCAGLVYAEYRGAAVVHRVVRQFRGSDCRGTGQGSGRGLRSAKKEVEAAASRHRIRADRVTMISSVDPEEGGLCAGQGR
jgi:K+-transporting ATPase ATPase B chain